LSYLANTQTNKQTNKNLQKHNLLGGGNKVDKTKPKHKTSHYYVQVA